MKIITINGDGVIQALDESAFFNSGENVSSEIVEECFWSSSQENEFDENRVIRPYIKDHLVMNCFKNLSGLLINNTFFMKARFDLIPESPDYEGELVFGLHPFSSSERAFLHKIAIFHSYPDCVSKRDTHEPFQSLSGLMGPRHLVVLGLSI